MAVNRKEVCHDIKERVRDNWKSSPVKYENTTNDTFLIQLREKYSECLIGKDTAYVSSLFGHNFFLQTAVFRKEIMDSLPVKFSMEYNLLLSGNANLDSVSKVLGIEKAKNMIGYTCRFAADGKGIIRYFQIDSSRDASRTY